MTKFYDFHIRVEHKRLATIISALEGAAQIIALRPCVEDRANATQAASKKHGFVNGKRDKGISGNDLVLEILSSVKRPWTYAEIAKIFVSRGFAGHSASPALSLLAKAKKIRGLGQGKYELVTGGKS